MRKKCRWNANKRKKWQTGKKGEQSSESWIIQDYPKRFFYFARVFSQIFFYSNPQKTSSNYLIAWSNNQRKLLSRIQVVCFVFIYYGIFGFTKLSNLTWFWTWTWLYDNVWLTMEIEQEKLKTSSRLFVQNS